MSDPIILFFSQYPEQVFNNALLLRKMLLKNLRGIIEQHDVPARMVAFVYGQRYIDMVCTIIPSQKGLKLGFAYGNQLPDPHGLLEGTAKLSRYVEIKTAEQINSAELKALLKNAVKAYKERSKQRKT